MPASCCVSAISYGQPRNEFTLVVLWGADTTYQIGKWHLGFAMDWQLPVERGFNASFGFLGGGEDHISQNGMLAEWGCHGTDLWSSRQPAIGQNGTYSGYIYNDAAVDIITQHPDVDTNPLFIYLATQTMHAPLEVPTRWSDLYPNTSVHDASDSGHLPFDCSDRSSGAPSRLAGRT